MNVCTRPECQTSAGCKCTSYLLFPTTSSSMLTRAESAESSLAAANAEIEKLRADLQRFKDERGYVVGHNDGFDCAKEQLAEYKIVATLTARLADLEAGLKPFADIADLYDDSEDDGFGVWDDSYEAEVRSCLRLRNFRRARALLQKDKNHG